MEWLQANWKEIGELVLAVLGVFSIVAKITPTQTDDKILKKLFSFVHFFGLTKKDGS